MRGRRIVHDRYGHRAKHGAQIWTYAKAFGYREICPSRQFPSGMWRLRPISPPVAAGGHDRFIGCLDAYEDVRGVRRGRLDPGSRSSHRQRQPLCFGAGPAGAETLGDGIGDVDRSRAAGFGCAPVEFIGDGGMYAHRTVPSLGLRRLVGAGGLSGRKLHGELGMADQVGPADMPRE